MWHLQWIRNDGRPSDYISASQGKLLPEVSSPPIEPLLSAMNEVSISIGYGFTNRTSPISGVAYKPNNFLPLSAGTANSIPSDTVSHKFSRLF